MKEQAMRWWNNLLFVEKWEHVVQCKEYIIGYPDRNVDSLTGSEIEKIYSILYTDRISL